MKNYIIITDSSVNLSKEELNSLGFEVFYFSIIFNNEQFLDNKERDINFFCNLLNKTKKKLFQKELFFHTSQPSHYLIKNKITSFLSNYKKVYLFITSKYVSGIYYSIKKIILQNEWKDRVILFDCENIADGLLEYAMFWKDNCEKYSIEEFQKILDDHKKRRKWLIFPTDIKYLKNSGRISSTAATISNALRIKISLTFEQKAQKLFISTSSRKLYEKSLNYLYNNYYHKEATIFLYFSEKITKETNLLHSYLVKKFKDNKIILKQIPLLMFSHNGNNANFIYYSQPIILKC
ncbi:DegV family EDD domain-containing protein [symbiont of Argiope bruennichi]|uniref:DegV family protein n=1 Tax=symbiont of Argiope bruennichi TaxID=2810479 RepID=UPI003DA54C2F